MAAIHRRSKIRKYGYWSILAQLVNLELGQRSSIRTNAGRSLIRSKWKSGLFSKYPEYFPGYQGFLGIHSLRAASILELSSISIPYQLHSKGRNSMMFSIESRVPFLDHRLVEQMINLDPDNFYANGLDKQPLRRGMKDMLPQKILERTSKLGFASSDSLWMRDNPDRIRPLLVQAVAHLSEMINGKSSLPGLTGI